MRSDYLQWRAVLAAAAVLGAYLVGSISFPAWIARRRGINLRAVGSRKLSGSNLIRAVGPALGTLGGVLDGAKGFGAIAAAGALGLATESQLACGVAALSGQMWPVFHRFDGGRANATGWGFALAADPIAAAIMGIPLLAAAALRLAVRPRPTRVLPLAALASFAVWPAAIWESDGTTPQVVAGLVVLGLITIRRVTAGLAADLQTGAPRWRILANRTLFDRSELQQRGDVEV